MNLIRQSQTVHLDSTRTGQQNKKKIVVGVVRCYSVISTRPFENVHHAQHVLSNSLRHLDATVHGIVVYPFGSSSHDGGHPPTGYDSLKPLSIKCATFPHLFDRGWSDQQGQERKACTCLRAPRMRQGESDQKSSSPNLIMSLIHARSSQERSTADATS